MARRKEEEREEKGGSNRNRKKKKGTNKLKFRGAKIEYSQKVTAMEDARKQMISDAKKSEL